MRRTDVIDQQRQSWGKGQMTYLFSNEGEEFVLRGLLTTVSLQTGRGQFLTLTMRWETEDDVIYQLPCHLAASSHYVDFIVGKLIVS